MKILELRGYKSLRALQVFHTLMLGLKMLPMYMAESYEEFFERIEKMEAASQEKMIREAALFVELKQDEIEAIMCFATDKNGIPYVKENLRNLGPSEIHEIIVTICVEVSKIKINLVTEDEKKKYLNSSLTPDGATPKIPA
jgi:hypothetical protein